MYLRLFSAILYTMIRHADFILLQLMCKKVKQFKATLFDNQEKMKKKAWIRRFQVWSKINKPNMRSCHIVQANKWKCQAGDCRRTNWMRSLANKSMIPQSCYSLIACHGLVWYLIPNHHFALLMVGTWAVVQFAPMIFLLATDFKLPVENNKAKMSLAHHLIGL